MDSDPDIFAVLAAPCLTEQPQKKPLWMEVHYLQNAPFMCISSSREIYGDFCYAAISSLLMKANCISSPAAQHQGKFKTQHRQHPTLFMLPLPFIPVWSRAWPDHQKLIYSALRSRSGAVSAVDMVLMDEERSSKRRRVWRMFKKACKRIRTEHRYISHAEKSLSSRCRSVTTVSVQSSTYLKYPFISL